MGKSKKVGKFLNTVKISSKDIAMEFDICRYAHITMKAGKFVCVSEIELSSGEVIPELEPDKDHKYLGILKVNNIMHTERKDKIQKEYCRGVRQLTLLKYNGGNTISLINSNTKVDKKRTESYKQKGMKLWQWRELPSTEQHRQTVHPRMEGGSGLCGKFRINSFSISRSVGEKIFEVRFSKKEKIFSEHEGPAST